jgi:alkylated DNA repair dioxygenase AlkB
MLSTNILLNENDSYLYIIDNYFPTEYANQLFQKCKVLDLEVEPEMKMGIAHRCVGFYSDSSEGYEFSGQTAEASPLPDYLRDFLHGINASLNTQFNGLLINYYRNGEDIVRNT